MKIILTEQCMSLTGLLGRGFGYAIVKRKNGFFSQRCNHKVNVPRDGHWRFIAQCAELARMGLHIQDIKVDWLELQSALFEAKCFIASEQVRRNYAEKNKTTYDARDILNLKTTFGL